MLAKTIEVLAVLLFLIFISAIVYFFDVWEEALITFIALLLFIIIVNLLFFISKGIFISIKYKRYSEALLFFVALIVLPIGIFLYLFYFTDVLSPLIEYVMIAIKTIWIILFFIGVMFIIVLAQNILDWLEKKNG